MHVGRAGATGVESLPDWGKQTAMTLRAEKEQKQMRSKKESLIDPRQWFVACDGILGRERFCTSHHSGNCFLTVRIALYFELKLPCVS